MPFVVMYNRGSIMAYFQTILWPLLFETSYLFCLSYSKSIRSLRKIFILIAIYGTYLFLQTRLNISEQTNTVFFVLLTLPWFIFSSNKKRQILFLAFFTFLTLLSMKRSAIIIIALSWLFFFIIQINDRKRWFITLFIVGILSFFLYYGFERIDQQLGGQLTERITREETDEGGNRLAIWKLTSLMITNSSPIKMVIGHGHHAVKRDSFLQLSAHNDFLEVIYDYGLIIFVLYICLWIFVIKRCLLLFKIRSPLFLPYAISLGIFIVMSMVSHLILYTNYFNFIVIFWGSVEALKQRDLLLSHV